MNDINNMTFVKRILFYIVFALITIAHFFLTFVVTLLLLGTLNILNERTLMAGNLSYIEGMLTILTFGASTWIFFKSFKKVSDFIKLLFFRNHS